MTERINRRAARTSFCLLVAFVLSCATSGKVFAFAQPEPLPPDFVYGDNFADDTESLMLLSRLKQLAEKHRIDEQIEHEIADEQIEREIAHEQIEIQAMLEAKARERANAARPDYSVEESEPAEALPIPAAMVHHELHPSKRHGINTASYISLCYFKICKMDRRGNRNKSS